MNIEKLISDIRNTGDYIPDQYDGSYELVRSIIDQYALLNNYDKINHFDLNAVYGMAIGTWKLSIEKKKEYIAKTCLSDASKETLFEICDHVWDRACRKDYQHDTEASVGEGDSWRPVVGMFGTGFYSFSNTGADACQSFIRMCTEIRNMEDDEQIFKIVEPVLAKGINGMGAGSASVILHCLKPYTFPIINGNFTGETLFPILGVQLKKQNSLKTFIVNCRTIKKYRDDNFGRINYRVFDEISLNLDEYRENSISIAKLKEAIQKYKNDFERVKKEETYKWIAIKCFKDHFDINAEDFRGMLSEAFKKEFNLLSGAHYAAKQALLDLAEAEPETVRQMFRDLYDENVPVLERIEAFRQTADECHDQWFSKDEQSYQSHRAISVYLFFEYPEKYCMYMPSKFDAVAEYLEFGELAPSGSIQKTSQYFKMAEQIYDFIKTDDELIQLSRTRLTDECYQDPNNHVLAEDLIWFIFRLMKMNQPVPNGDSDQSDDDHETKSDYWPSEDEYPVNLTKEDWKKYLLEIEMPHHPLPMKMLKGMMELGGEASPKQLSEIYGGSPPVYIGNTINLGRRMKNYFNLPACPDGDVERVFPIPFQGHSAEWNGKNYYSYRIRPALQDALNELDLSGIDPHYAIPDKPERYWLYAPGEKAVMWNECVKEGIAVIGWDELEDLSQYESRDEIVAKMKEIYGDESHYWMNSKATWEFSHVIQPGDIIFAKKGRSKLVGRGRVTSEYYYDHKRGEYPNVINVEWTDVGEWDHPGLAQVKTLTEIDKLSEYAQKLNQIFDSNQIEEYSKENFLSEAFISEDDYEELKQLLEIKKNIILQGAPGVGKTFIANRLAYAIMGEKDDSRIEFIQFHQNYSYEDFIMGYKPDENGGFVLREGVFYEFCKRAEADPKREYFFIIDEINRGNLSKIFGEMLMAIEADYRGEPVRLAYTDEPFSVPKNIRLIGMMNTADRSLALIDYALRRRFSFVSMKPGFETDGFKAYQTALHNDEFDALIAEVIKLNQKIIEDESLGEGFRIGHSYFCNLNEETCTSERMKQIVRYDLIPTLEEYWFDNKDMLNTWKKNLEDTLK